MDAYLVFGGDLVFSSTGDVLLANTQQATQQRVLRRLLTNPGDYIQHPDYGAGLGRFVGDPNSARKIQAAVTQQMKLERGVALVPPPTVTVKSDQSGTYTLNVSYTDQASGQIVSLPTQVLGP